ncbi:MAG: DUF4430 domain-containing protein [Clostridia bacterium]|nr:DUF4430 domain-containing protein [Clostridia bacterium]
MKRILLVWLSLCLLLCACKLPNTKPAKLEKSIAVPKDGIVRAETLQKLKDDNGVTTFYGKDGDVRYEWVVFGSKINKPRDYNLKVKIQSQGDSEITFSIADDFDFAPTLSLYLTEKWDWGTVVVTTPDGTPTTATLTADKNSIINVTVGKAGTYTVALQKETEAPPEKTDEIAPEPTAPTKTQTDSKPEKKKPAGSTSSTGKREYSDATATGQDKYHTDPVPQGKPLPVDKPTVSAPSDSTSDTKTESQCTISIECSSILNHLGDLNEEKLDVLPEDGIILEPTVVTLVEGESVYDLLRRICDDFGIHMEASFTPMYNSYYIEGIGNIYEFDCGSGSGWMYRVNGWYPNYGCSRYALQNGDVIEFRYTCDIGNDIGGGVVSE